MNTPADWCLWCLEWKFCVLAVVMLWWKNCWRGCTEVWCCWSPIPGTQLELASLPDRSMSPSLAVTEAAEKLRQTVQMSQVRAMFSVNFLSKYIFNCVRIRNILDEGFHFSYSRLSPTMSFDRLGMYRRDRKVDIILGVFYVNHLILHVMYFWDSFLKLDTPLHTEPNHM